MKRFTVFMAMLAMVLIGTVFFTSVQAEELYIEMPGEETTYQTDDLPDSDQLAADFISSIMPSRGRTQFRARAPRGLNLTETEATVYNLLLADITAVANGERASTVFEYDPVVIYGQTSFSKEYLRVDELISGNQFAQEALDAINAIVCFDIDPITSALLANCPYELYWYDKTAGIQAKYPGYWTDGENIYLGGDVSISFCVSADYAPDNVTGGYNCDTSFGQNAQAAAAKANQIVADYAGNSDDSKLRGYASEICTLTSYNDEAAAGGIAYGNPWQLVWVFDENPNTRVVCEGYSKAFQYLCNLTNFSGNIGVITVTGIMRGGTGEGRHMWNLVRLNDGFNYLVDVTNIDEGTIGYPNQLMLAKASSGSVEDGYGFDTDGGPITYVYDSSIKSYYTADELTLRNVNDPPYLGLTTILIPDGTRRIESEAFAQTGAEVIIIPEGCEFIADDAFANCENLVYIVNRSTVQVIVPEGVTLITE